MKSLRSQLTAVLTLILIFVFISLWGALSFAINTVAKDQLMMHLRHDGDALLSALSFNAEGVLSFSKNRVEDVYLRLNSGNYFVVHTSDGLQLSSPSLGNSRLSFLMQAPESSSKTEVSGPDGQTVLVLTRNFILQNKIVSITIGEDLTDLEKDIKSKSVFVLVLVLMLLLAAVILQSISIHRALSPLAGLQVELQMISRGEIDKLDAIVPLEITPLVEEVNRLLKVVNRRLLQSRTAVGNLAHALKTPLAVLFQIVDDASLEPRLREELKSQTQIIREKIERELKRARLAGGEGFISHFKLNTELQVMSRILNGIYRSKQLAIDFEVPEYPVPFDREDILELLGNLADNACKWARSRVFIKIETLDDFSGIKFLISDDGPGCSQEEIKLLGQWGMRLDESTYGHGLGLSICHDIVEFYGGQMDFDRDPALGGLRVQVQLPKHL